MTTRTRTRKPAQQKNVEPNILGTYRWNHADRVLYKVRANAPLAPDESTDYETVVRDGKRYNVYQVLINGGNAQCNCPAIKPCYHMVQLERREIKREAHLEAEKIAALALVEYREQFPYGLRVATPDGAGIIVGDVIRSFYGALVAIVDVDGELHCVSILDLLVLEQQEAHCTASTSVQEQVVAPVIESIPQTVAHPRVVSVTNSEESREKMDDPWEGLDEDAKWTAWRNYEMNIG